MIFSELYSAYYNTVAKIMEAAFNPEATEKDLQRCVMEEAFSESVLTILPALKSGKWPLLHEDLSPVLLHKPTMPLTNLEKRWLKAIAVRHRCLYRNHISDAQRTVQRFRTENAGE